MIFVQAADGVAMDYKQAQAFMDKRLEERKRELGKKCANARIRECENGKPRARARQSLSQEAK